MKHLPIFTIVLTLAAAGADGAPANKARTVIQGGFVSGKAYLDLPALRKIAYVTGLLDGMFLAPVFGGTVARQAWFGLCIDTIGRPGIRDILVRRLRADERTWDNRNPAKMYRAIRTGCRKGDKPARAKPEQRKQGGYITGKAYLDMFGLQKLYYAGGLVEGVFLTPAFGADAQAIKSFAVCVDRLRWSGVLKAINKRLLAEPKLWTSYDPEPRYRAIVAACAKSGG
jgi:hypothetical protein